MLKLPVSLLLSFLFLLCNRISAQTSVNKLSFTELSVKNSFIYTNDPISKQFLSTIDFLDAATTSLNSFSSLLKKEAYRIKITSFNNPTSSDMGFNLEHEIQTALKPLLEKAKNTSPQKFSSIVSSIISSGSKSGLGKSLTSVSPVFPTLLSLVGNLAVGEKKITREDLDSFITVTSKYFVQYEKLNGANNVLDQNIDRLNTKMRDMQFDLKEYMLDMITLLYKGVQRTTLKNRSNEELLLTYLDRQKVEERWEQENLAETIRYPSDGIKGAKDLAYNLQKLFNDYQKVYTENYGQIKIILQDAKKLGKNINVLQVDASLKEVEELYNESKVSDVLSIRLSTLFERLKNLTATEQVVSK